MSAIDGPPQCILDGTVNPVPLTPLNEFTPRGFRIYARVEEDRHHSKVWLQESSLADEPCVWIFCSPARDDHMEPHLTVEQAKIIRDGLSEFIAEKEGANGGA